MDVLGEIHHAHPASPDQRVDAVPGDRGPEGELALLGHDPSVSITTPGKGRGALSPGARRVLQVERVLRPNLLARGEQRLFDRGRHRALFDEVRQLLSVDRAHTLTQ